MRAALGPGCGCGWRSNPGGMQTRGGPGACVGVSVGACWGDAGETRVDLM